MKKSSLWMALIAALLALLLWLAFVWEPAPSVSSQAAAPQETEKPAGGDFQLTSPDGPVALSDFRGKVVALYFGYTFCPDVCPTSLVALAQAFALLPPHQLEKTKGLFVTVDPERDKLDILKVYVPYFHPALTGLTGSAAQIAEVARRYGVRYMKQQADKDGLYSVDHSSFIALIGPDGKLVTHLPHGTPPQEIARKIQELLPHKNS